MYKPIEYEGKNYTQLKEITGKDTYNAQPDKDCGEFCNEFDLFTGNYGWIRKLSLDEEEVSFWKDAHPSWLDFLESHEFVKIEVISKIKVGDIVEVVNDGKRYASYLSLAKSLGTVRFVSSENPATINGCKGRVIAIRKHKDDEIMVALVDILSEEILIAVDGLKFVR